MRQSSLIAAHLAAHSYRYSVFAPGLGYVAASGTVAEEMSHYYDQSPVISQLCLHLWFAGKVNSQEASKTGMMGL